MLRKITLALAAFLLVVGLATFSDSSTARAAALHPTVPTKALTCTPGNYHEDDETWIYDQGTGTYIGTVVLWDDGCGWAYASASSSYSPGLGKINHIELHRGDGTLITAAPYNGSNYNRTDNINVGTTTVYAYGVIQVASPYNYWGNAMTANCSAYV